jgi:hypothetical protein
MKQQQDEAARVKRWRRGHAAAAERQRRLLAEEGPRPAQAVAESLSALNALAKMGLWPGPRDEISERAVEVVRRRWAKIQKRAKQQALARRREGRAEAGAHASKAKPSSPKATGRARSKGGPRPRRTQRRTAT